MAMRKFIVLATAVSLWISQAAVASDVVYDTLSQVVDVNGNIGDGLWPGLSFKSGSNPSVLNAVTIAISNPNSATTGTISFSLYDALGAGGKPGSAIGSVLGSRSMNGISSASYDQVTFSGLSRNLSADTNYWIVLHSAGVGTAYYVAATTGTGGLTAGSTGFTQSLDLGVNWNSPSTSNYIVGQVVTVPEPATLVMGTLAGLALAIRAWFARHSARAAARA